MPLLPPVPTAAPGAASVPAAPRCHSSSCPRNEVNENDKRASVRRPVPGPAVATAHTEPGLKLSYERYIRPDGRMSRTIFIIFSITPKAPAHQKFLRLRSPLSPRGCCCSSYPRNEIYENDKRTSAPPVPPVTEPLAQPPRGDCSSCTRNEIYENEIRRSVLDPAPSGCRCRPLPYPRTEIL